MLEIKSLGDTLNGAYDKPDPALVDKYKQALSDKALAYLKTERNLTDETIAHFGLGYDEVRDAISIPVYKGGVLVNIKYRFLNPTGAKYIGKRGAETWLYNDYGIIRGVKKGKVLVVEGEFDLMSVWQTGIKNVVSPASGKNSYGVWVELLDKIPEVYIAYDNDSAGRETAREMAERVGVEKSFEVKYPEGVKDANEFFKTSSLEDFRRLLESARPFYTHQFKGMGDIITTLRNKKDDGLSIPYIPKVNMEKDWLVVISGKSNIGKTSYALNLADDFSARGIPTLIMPFERGIESVGKRFLQVKFEKTMNDFKEIDDKGWDEMIKECVETPVYFALPKKEDIINTIVKSKRLFNTRVVIIDHLDYIVRNTAQKEAEIGQTLQALKRVAEDNGVVMLIVTHIRKIEHAGSLLSNKTPGIEDLKGSASLYQDPECVIMLSAENEGEMKVDIVKNKGEMTSQVFDFNSQTGKLSISAFDRM